MTEIKSVLIVGGGSSGWMTATLLNQRLPHVRVTLIEASDIPIIGVGESTNPVIRYFHQIAGVSEKTFMRGANAAFKCAIRFKNFNRLGGVFYHPFGQPRRVEDVLFQPRAETHHVSYHLAETGTLFSPECSYAYQVDAGLYGQSLKEICKARGVHHVVDRVLEAERGENGDITAIRTASSGSLTADLYIDCSGFRSFLLEKTLHEPFHPVTRFLLNDRAIAARMPYIDRDSELKTYTNCTGLSAGWVWEIPLWSRLGLGYVYSSAFQSAADAEAEFRAFVGPDRLKDVPLNHIDLRSGRHERAWVGNCVGIGVSYGFLEPLESTGLSLTQISLIDLARELAQGATDEGRRRFNERHARIFDTTRDFVMAHFVLSARDDSPYWRHVREIKDLPDSLLTVLEQAALGSFAPVESQQDTFYDVLNWNLILSGMGWFDQRPAIGAQIVLPAAEPHAGLLRATVHVSGDDEVEEPAATGSFAHAMWNPTW